MRIVASITPTAFAASEGRPVRPSREEHPGSDRGRESRGRRGQEEPSATARRHESLRRLGLVERRVVGQDCSFERLQLGTRLETQLVGEARSRLRYTSSASACRPAR